MDAHYINDTQLSNAELAAELERLGVPYVAFSREERREPPPDPELFVASLAMSDESRLRMALIPLFLVRPDIALLSSRVANVLTDQSRVTLVFYYTAAMLLQRKYARRPGRASLLAQDLPDLFGRELVLPLSHDVDSALEQLGNQHAIMSGRPLNWVGTYGHAAKQLLKRTKESSR